MVQGYGKPVQNTRPTPYRMRQDLGYIPARAMPEGDGGGGISSTGGPTAPVLSLTPIADGTFLGNLTGALATPIATAFIFTKLRDVPATYVAQAKKLVRVNAGETALEFHTEVFTDLADVPSTYVGQTLKVVRVNAGETALEFVNLTQTTPVLPWCTGDAVTPGLLFGFAQTIAVLLTNARQDTTFQLEFQNGLAAARPLAAIALPQGCAACYLATDTGKFFLGLGNVWTQTN